MSPNGKTVGLSQGPKHLPCYSCLGQMDHKPFHSLPSLARLRWFRLLTAYCYYTSFCFYFLNVFGEVLLFLAVPEEDFALGDGCTYVESSDGEQGSAYFSHFLSTHQASVNSPP